MQLKAQRILAKDRRMRGVIVGGKV